MTRRAFVAHDFRRDHNKGREYHGKKYIPQAGPNPPFTDWYLCDTCRHKTFRGSYKPMADAYECGVEGCLGRKVRQRS